MALDIVALTPPNEAPNRQLGFTARTLRIDNPTAAYWYLPDQLRFIQPWATGVVISLPGTQVANIRFQAPPGMQQPTAYPGSAAASFVYDDSPSAPDSGTNLANAAFGRTVPSRVLPTVAGNNVFTDVFPVGAPDGFRLVPEYSKLPQLIIWLTLPNGAQLPVIQSGGTGGIWQIEYYGEDGTIHYELPVPAQTMLLILQGAAFGSVFGNWILVI